MVNTPHPGLSVCAARVMDPRGTTAMVGDNKINFFIYYEVDGDTSKHHLSASNYGRENEWVLLVPGRRAARVRFCGARAGRGARVALGERARCRRCPV